MKLELSFTLNSFKIPQKSSDFSVKMLNFLNAREASPPSPQYAASTKLLSFVLGAYPGILGKKPKWQEEKLGKNHKNSLASGAPPPNPLMG